MSRTTLLLILVLCVMAGLLGFNYVTHPFQAAQDVASPVATASGTVANDAAGTNLASMSTEQKIAMLMAAPLVISNAGSSSATVTSTGTGITTPSDSLAWIQHHQPGMVIVYGSQISQTTATDTIVQLKESYSGVQPLIAVDHEGGTVQRFSGAGFTKLPSWQSLCASSAGSSSALLQTSAAQLHQIGINMVLAPVVDVSSRSAVLGTRVCSSDPDVVLDRSLAFIQIMKSQHILPVVKHFPGTGLVKKDLHTSFDRVTISPADALLFKYLLDPNPTIGVMVAPVGVTNQYADVPCDVSLDCVKELSSSYPKALVMTDALDMKATSYNGDEAPLSLDEVAVRAVKAGNQLLVFSQAVTADELDTVQNRLVATYTSDPVFKAMVDQSVAKVLAAKQAMP